MGHKIIVNHTNFDTASKTIDEYTAKMKSNMSKADSSVKSMMSTWNGSDAQSFAKQWDRVNSTDSTYWKMKGALESYSKFLKFAGSKYKTAQANAINRANMLAKW